MSRTLDQLTLDDVLGAGGLFAQKLAGYEPRPAQRAMAELVAHGLEHGGVSLIEAGTGTGKTFAYLVPALLSGARVVISTGTRALQDQIALRDVPTLARLLDDDLPVAVLKGLSNYVCLRRHQELLSSVEGVSRPEIVKHLPVVQSFVQRAVTGEKRELPEVPEDAPIWSLVESGSDTRMGARCRFFDDCFVTRARVAAEAASVVVVNHHLFFADLALRSRGASVIPPYDAVVFDEAHQIGDVMTELFGLVISGPRVDRLVRDADRLMASLRVESPISERLFRKVLLATSDLLDVLGTLKAPGGGRSDARRTLSSEDREVFRDHLFDLEAALEAAGAHVRGCVDPEDRAHDVLPLLARRFDELRNDLLSVIEGGHGLVVWLESGRARGGRGGAVLGASPVDVSRHFRDEVIERTRAVILTSATLGAGLGAAGGSASAERTSEPPKTPESRVVPEVDEVIASEEVASRPPSAPSPFAFVRRELGIEGEVDELLLPSPFDYARQAALYLPELPDPRDPSFSAAAREEIEALITASSGGAFMLTTSMRVLEDLSRHLAPTLRRRGLEVLVQGELPKHLVLERFRAHGHAVLFATLGFWEGVDVPGHALRLVVLDRVPFDVPTDPLVKARCERIEEDGGSAFKEYLLPSAALTLRQGFGRLVRTERDRGLVAILDARMRNKGYGKLLLRALPNARRIEARADALAFLEEIRAAHV